MGCFTLSGLENLLVWLIIVGAIIAIIQLIIPLALQGWPPIIGQVLNIVLWAIVCIIVVWIVFALLSCLVGSGGLTPPHLGH